MSLKLIPANLDPAYRKKWNAEHIDGFCYLAKDGEKVRDSLYRVGAFGGEVKAQYFTLIKYTEAHYTDSITKDPAQKPHLAGSWCILNQDGVEKVVESEFKSLYLVDNSCVYACDSNYYNVETGEFYCNTQTVARSDEYLFLENRYDSDKSKRGVLQINKKDGTFILHKLSK